MKAVRIHGYGNATVLKYEDAADVESARHGRFGRFNDPSRLAASAR
jgi:hypothetical protein